MGADYFGEGQVVSLSPVLFSDGIHQTRTVPHPTIPRCMIICKWEDDQHSYSRAILYKGADGNEAWVPAFSDYIEKHDPHRMVMLKEKVATPDLKAWLDEVKAGNLYGAAHTLALCRFLGLNAEVSHALAVVRERNQKRTQEHDARCIKAKLDAEQRHSEAVEAARVNFLAGKMIAPGYFETLCERNGVIMHIRTIGTLRKRVTAIGTTEVHGHIKGAGMTGIFMAARALKEALTTPAEPHDPALDHLFGVDKGKVLVEIPIPKGP